MNRGTEGRILTYEIVKPKKPKYYLEIASGREAVRQYFLHTLKRKDYFLWMRYDL